MSTVKGYNTRNRVARRRIGGEVCVEESLVQRSPRGTISTLPHHVLLEIFKFYVDQIFHADAWHKLVHVCRHWRYVVFASPRWLRLELRCTNRSPVKKMDVWPALPIVIDGYITNSRRSGVRNLITALKRHDLVRKIKIWGVLNSLLKSAAMKKRFPELTDLKLFSDEDDAPVIPDSFLGGSAPRLKSLEFRGIRFLFPVLRELLLSATDLVTLRLLDIPSSGIVSPDQIVTSLSAMTCLQELSIGFRSPRPDQERRHPSLLNRFVLSRLTTFYFKGDSEYLENIVGGINAPALDGVQITFFEQPVFDTPLLRDFFSRAEAFQESHQAGVVVTSSAIKFMLFQPGGEAKRCMLEVMISSRVAERQVSSLAQFCSTSLPPLPALEHLFFRLDVLWGRQSSGLLGSALWLELLHPFVTVKHMDLVSGHLVIYVVPALRELTGEGVPEVLPVLRHVSIGHGLNPSGPSQDAIAQFIAARQLSGHLVTIHYDDAAK